MDVVDILEVVIRARGVTETNKALDDTQRKFTATERAAVDATDKVERFGHTTARPLVELQTAGLKVEIEQARQKLDDLSKETATPEVVVKTAKAAADLDRLQARLAKLTDKTITVRTRTISSGPDPTAGAGGGGVRDVTRGVDALNNSAAGATATIGGFRIALAALIPITIAFGGAATAAASSLGPLIGLAAAAGNALAAVGQGMGVFQLATFGVMDALKEQTTAHAAAGGAAASNAASQRGAARAIQSAQEGVRSATVALSDAEKAQAAAVAALAPAYTQARMKLTDMRSAVADSTLALSAARIAAREADQALTDLLSGPDPRVLADAHRTVTDAIQSENQAVQGLRDAYKALNDLLKPPDVLSVADAQDTVADSVRGEERARLDLNDALTKADAIMSGFPTDDQAARVRLDLADAENTVGDAARQTEHARRDLAKLEAGADQDVIAAARMRVSDAEYAVLKSVIDTRNARQDLAKAEAPASSLEVAKALQAVAEAQNEVRDASTGRLRATRELAAAEAAGIQRSADVVAATDAIEQANRGVADAARNVQQAELALSDAHLAAAESAAGAAAAAGKLNDKFNSLPPAAKAFVRVLQSMKPKLDELRATAASGFFPGATEGLQAAARNFDSVNKVVGETATVLGEAARKSGELVGSPAFGKDLETIGHRNAQVLDTLGEALRHVVSALRYVALAAGPLTQHLADLVLGWTRTAASSAKAGQESGRLAGFFEKTEQITRRLLSVIGHLASGLLGVGKAGKGTGDQIWVSIDRAAQRFDEWANSTKGQDALKDFFRESKELAAAIIPAIAGIAKAVGLLVFKTPFTATLKLLGPLADEALIAFVAFKAAVIAWNVQAGIAAFTTGGWATAFWALNAAMLANPIGLVVIAIAALVGAFVLLGGNLGTIGDAFGWLWGVIKDGATAVLGWLTDHWPLVLAILAGPIGLAVLAVVKHWDAIKAATTTVFNAVKGFLADVWEAISGVVSGAVSGVRTAVSSAWDAISRVTSTVWGAVSGFVTGAISGAWDAVKGTVTTMTTWLGDAWGTIRDKARDVWDAVKSAITGAVSGAYEKVKGLISDFVNIGSDIVKGIARGITDAASSVADAVGDVVKGAVKKAKSLLSIGSPSRVFMDIGMQTGAGFAQGIAGQIVAAQNAIAAMTAAPTVTPARTRSQAATAAGTGAAMAGRTGPLIVQNIERYVVGERDDNAVAARLAWIMDSA